MENEISFHVGDFAFLADRVLHSRRAGYERLVVVWQVHEDGRLELIGSGSQGRERFEINYFQDRNLIRKPTETEGRMIASVWFSVSSATGVRWDRAVQAAQEPDAPTPKGMMISDVRKQEAHERSKK